MARPLVLDARNLLDPAHMKVLGFEYHSFGRPDEQIKLKRRRNNAMVMPALARVEPHPRSGAFGQHPTQARRALTS